MKQKVSLNRIVERGWKAYERFLYLCAKYPPGSPQAKSIHPSYFVDLFWHAHMCDASNYQKDVENIVGYFLIHDPWPAEVSTAKDNSATKSLWKSEFDFDLDQECSLDIGNSRYYDQYDE